MPYSAARNTLQVKMRWAFIKHLIASHRSAKRNASALTLEGSA
jgi:hypothetical protein